MPSLKITLVIVFTSAALSCQETGMNGKTDNSTDSTKEDQAVNSKSYPINIYTQNQMQKITLWGHDIKQKGKAQNLTVAACRQIFQSGEFNLLRIPIYAMAHNADGSVKEDYLISMELTHNNNAQWEKIPYEGEWFSFKNRTHNKHMKGFKDNALEMDTSRDNSHQTQWKLVDAAGDGWFHIENRAYNKYIKGNPNGDISLAETSNRGSWTQWKLVDTGNGYYYIENRAQNKNLKGDGNAYKPIIEAINRAKTNGRPALYASHKIYDSKDQSTFRNANFGPFYSSGSIDVVGFAACIDAYLAYMYDKTGETVKYLAPRCELGNHWTSNDFIQVVNYLTNPPLIVSPEAAYTVNSESFWKDVAHVTDIKSTHNKDNSPLWPSKARYDWDGETVGGDNEKFIKLFYKLNEAFYKGEVTGIVFWGDTHLNNTDDNNNNGSFRRELVKASAYNLIKCDAASGPEGSAIAFQTAEKNEIKIFYSSTEPVVFNFDRKLYSGSIPADASNVTHTSFEMNATGVKDYHSFIIKFTDNDGPGTD
jgi:hypothetical protein